MSFDATYPFSLPSLPPAGIPPDAEFGRLLLNARVELAELKGACGLIPNPMLLTAPVVIRESVASSGIENINTTVAKVLQWQLFPEAEQHQPDKEVLRYRTAMTWGFEKLDKLAISTRLITGIQTRLIPEGNGNYRREQNQIVNLTTHEAFYTPPPANEISRLIGNWENYVNNREEQSDPLIHAIVAHYQFEAIHPFRDGNGRTGRILMVLQLIQDKLLSLPVLYISGYINKHRTEYYQKLRAVTTDQDWQSYIEYMLEGFFLQARETRERLEEITNLHQRLRERIRLEAKKIYSAELVEALFTFPVLSPVKLAQVLGMHYTTTSRYLAQLAGLGILDEAVVGKYHLYANHELIAILSKQ
jgi:Fic family protein